MTGICISSLLFLIFLAQGNSLRAGGQNVRTTYETYYVSELTNTKVTRYRRTCTQTCDAHFLFCWSKKTVCTTYPYYAWSSKYKRVARTRPKYSCYSGWKPNYYGSECTIPICTSPCQHGGTCTSPNTCRCTSGWTGSSCRSDINECSSYRNRCSYKPGCVNTPGSYRCTCRVGYYLASDQRTCRDINECRSGQYPCGVNTYCANTQGSYSCPCNSGYTQNPVVRNSCKDINECDPISGVVHGCQRTCNNYDGFYNCSCPSGHYIASNGKDCTDHDECQGNSHHCQQNCINYPGGYNCTCDFGYRQNKTDYKSCNDINECSEKIAGCAQNCTNQIGSYNCSCRTGYYLGTDSKSCNDFDECSADIDGCQHNCLNTLGSYYCTCRPGFDLLRDGRTCSGRPCFPIYSPVNGMMYCLGYSTEHVCNFTCSPGYDIIGSSNRTCNSTKIWSGEETKCKIIHCPTPIEPSNGFVYSPCATQFDSQCTVGCSRGYYINGTNKIMTCDANGAWQAKNVTCREVKVCQPNPCLHGGICTSISSDQYSCDCTQTGYRGTNCGVGFITTPNFPTLTTGVPFVFAFRASPPSVSITLTLAGRGLKFNPLQLHFQNDGPRIQYLRITAPRPGLYFIRYRLSGPSAADFQSPPMDTIFVTSIFSPTPGNEPLPNELPLGCHKHQLNKCPHSNDVILVASTSPWVTYGPVTMTKGVVNVEVGPMNVPLSLLGTNLPNANQIPTPESCTQNDDVSYSLEQFMKSRILVKSFLNAVNESLPKWLRVTLRNNTTSRKIDMSEQKTRYLTGKLLQDTDIGEGQPVVDESYYSLLSSQNLDLAINNSVDLLGSRGHNDPLSLAVDLCSPAPKTVLLRPSFKDMDLVNDNSVVKRLRENGWDMKFYSAQISKGKLIRKLRKGVLWNGKRFFEVDSSANGNLALVSSLKKSFKDAANVINSNVEFQGTIVADFNNLDNILDAPLDQEWKVDLYGNIALTSTFKVEGKMTNLTLKAPQSIGYASLGGDKQKGCQTDTNYDPQGLFLTTTLSEDPFAHSELRRFVELSSKKTIACFLDIAINKNMGSLSNYIEKNDGISMAFHGDIKFGPLRFHNLDIKLAIQNSRCPNTTTNSSQNTGVQLTGVPNETQRKKFGIFEHSSDMDLRIYISRDHDSNSIGSFQSIAHILGFKKMANVSVSKNGFNFATSGKVHGLFDASMECSSKLAPWDNQLFTVAGEFEDNAVRGSLKDFLEEQLKIYAVEVLKKATSRVAAAKETEKRARDRLENVLMFKNNTMERLQRIRKEYEMAERELESAVKNLARFEKEAKDYGADVDELKADLEALCTVRQCPDVCLEGVVCTTCYEDIIGKTMGTCPATCLKTEQRRLPPYTEVAICARPKCTRIHNTNGIFKQLLGSFLGGIIKSVLSFGITIVATALGAPPPLASAIGSGLVTILDTGRVDEALCSVAKGAVTGFIGGPGVTKVFKEYAKISVKEGVKHGAVALGRSGVGHLVGKAISCQREQRDGQWRCHEVAVRCNKGRFEYEYEHFPYGCKESCEKETVTKTIEKSCCSIMSCASFIVNITCVAENALCKQAREAALDRISKTKTNAAKILRNLASARRNVSYWRIKKQKERIRLVSASRSLNASQDAVRSLEKAYNVTVAARTRKLEILAKPLKLRELFDPRLESLVMVKIEEIRFNVKVSAARENTLLLIHITVAVNRTRKTLTTVLDFNRLNTSLRSIAKEILSMSVGDLSSVSRKRRSVEDEPEDLIPDQRFLALKTYHRLCSEFTNYKQTLYDVVSSLQNLSSEARSLQANMGDKNDSSAFNVSDVLTRFNVNNTMALKLGIAPNASFSINQLNTDPELDEANNLEQEATKDGREPLYLASKLLVYNWYAIMEEIFNESSIANECSGFEDCLKYTIDNLYEIYSDIDLPKAPHVREHISTIETKLAVLTQSINMSVDDAAEISSEILQILDDMAKVSEVCASPPNITTYPEAFTEIGVGKTLSLTCNATGSSLVYKWRFNGEILQDQSTNTFLIKNTTVSHTGNYTCEVSNHITTESSIPASVTVHPPPLIITQPVRHLSLALSSEGSLECLAKSSDLDITYQWLFKPVNSISFLQLENETFSYRSFPAMKTADEGWYFCNVSSAYGYSISRTSFVKALHFTLPVPVAALTLSVIRTTQQNATERRNLNSSSYEDMRARISELLSAFANHSAGAITNLQPVSCEFKNSPSNNSRDNFEVCQWKFLYMGKNATSNSSIQDDFEVNAKKVINASQDVKQEIGELVNSTNNGSMTFSVDNQTYSVERFSLGVQDFYLHCPQRQTLVQEDLNCVDCPPGSYGELDDNEKASCQFCPLGSYQTNSGQLSCETCLEGFTTVNEGSYDKSQCKVICAAGHYGVITKNIGQCFVCPVNTYQPMQGQFGCLACPTGQVTNTEGTTDVTKCFLEPTQPTQKPTQPTQKPTEPTQKPTEPTQKPTEPIQKPTEPTQTGGPTTGKRGGEATNVALIGGVVGGIVFIGLLGLLLFILYRRKQHTEKPDQQQREKNEPSRSTSTESREFLDNAAYTSNLNYEDLGDSTVNSIYETPREFHENAAYMLDDNIYETAYIENPTQNREMVQIRGGIASNQYEMPPWFGKPLLGEQKKPVKPNLYELPTRFGNPLFAELNQPNKSTKVELPGVNTADKRV